MTRLTLLLAALLASAPAAAQNPSTQAPAAKPDPEAPSPKLQTLLENCDAHKFETTVETQVDGKPHRSKVKLCGKEGQSDSDWIGTLDDAIAKLDANTEMDSAVRDQIVTAVRAEIARLESGAPEAAMPESSLTPRLQASPAPLADDYSVLPPLPSPQSNSRSAPAAAAATAGGGSIAAASSPPRVVVPAVRAQKPNLAFSCISPDYPGGGECISLSRDTVVAAKAGEALPDSVSLRFLRNGQSLAEVPLGAMRKGQRVRFDLPRQVCSGVSSAEIQMEIVRSGQVVDRRGPFLLRC